MDKSADQDDGGDGEDGPRPQLPPIREAAASDLASELLAPSGEPTPTPLGGGALPASFEREGRRIVWRVDTRSTA